MQSRHRMSMFDTAWADAAQMIIAGNGTSACARVKAVAQKGPGSPRGVGWGGGRARAAPAPVVFGQARPQPLAPPLERAQNGALVGPAPSARLHHEPAVDVDAVHV